MGSSGSAGGDRRGARAGRSQRMTVVLLGAAALIITACTASPPAHGKRRNEAAPPPRPPVPRVTITPANGSNGAKPGQGVTVAVAGGTLGRVSVTRGSDPVSGEFNAARTAWHSTWALRPSHNYAVTATAANSSGARVTRTSHFRTLTPPATFRTQIIEGYHQTYGVGMPIILTFSHRVTHKAVVERAMELWTSKPVVGAWYWESSTSLVFRPRSYWPQHTRVRFVAHLDGVEAAPGVYGTANLTQSFRIGNSLIAVVSASKHYAKIYYKNKLFGRWPVSTGAPGDDTANGTYLTIEKHNPTLMSGPGYTDFPVPYSVRFTWSGNYMHDAYWSVAEQGYTNVSHGCVNMSPAHARVYYNLAVPGDPVTVTGSPVAGAWGDGWTEWFLTWHQFLRGSATHQAVEAGPSGSSFVHPHAVPPETATSPLHTSRKGNSSAA